MALGLLGLTAVLAGPPAAITSAAAGAGAQEVGALVRLEQLAAVRDQVAALEAELASLERRGADLVASYARTRAELRLQERRVEEAELAAVIAEQRLAETIDQLAVLERELDQRRELLRRRLVSIQSFGRRGYLELFLSLDAESNVLVALRQLRFLIRSDDQAVRLYRQTRDGLNSTRNELARRRHEAERWRQLQASRRDELALTRRREGQLLADLERRREALRDESAHLQTKGARLERLGAALAAEGTEPLSGVPIQEFEGALDWPLAGEIGIPFGTRRDPRYGTEVPHNGIELRVEEGAQVRAVYPGEVRFAAQFQDLGFTVVIQHSGRVLTLYAGLAELLVKEGDMVGFDTAIGLATPSLYFEIRVGTTPRDPRSWLR